MNRKELLNYWKKNLYSCGIREDLAEKYFVYSSNLIDKNVPIIFDFRHLCLLLERNTDYLSSVVNSSEHHYRTFSIPKKTSGFREITVPYPALMQMQYWILNNILRKIKINQAAHGYAHKKSIITNSKQHIRQNHFLKIDLKDFFPSIKINRVIALFLELGYTDKVAYYLASICCYDNELPQGAPSSPMISNIVTRYMDYRLAKFAKKFDLTYTRYADDLAFSGPNIPSKFIEYIYGIILECGFEINPSKTQLHHSASKRILTGISISDNEIKLPRSYKRKLKQELFYVKTYGLSSHVRKKKIKNINYLNSLMGKTMFWLNIEPDSDYALKSYAFLKELSLSLNYDKNDQNTV